MSVNENQEFEAINKKVKERSEIVEENRLNTENSYRDATAKRKAKAGLCIIVVAVVLGVSLVGFWGLEKIGWINATFRIVLMCLAGAVAMFKTGYFWHEFKK